MDTLHILRSIPDAQTEKMMICLSDGLHTNTIKLYEADTDWEDVVDAIFAHSKVVCWW